MELKNFVFQLREYIAKLVAALGWHLLSMSTPARGFETRLRSDEKDDEAAQLPDMGNMGGLSTNTICNIDPGILLNVILALYWRDSVIWYPGAFI